MAGSEPSGTSDESPSPLLHHALPLRSPATLGGFDPRVTPLLQTDVLVVGGGIGGGAAAVSAAEAGASVLLLTKSAIEESNTAFAQGGVAATLGREDSIELHVADTVRVGDGLTDIAVARAFIEEGQSAVAWLESLGARFDHGPDGELMLSREGGHSVPRVVHAGGAATGAEIARVLMNRFTSDPRISVRPDSFVRDLLIEEGRCVGVVSLVAGTELAVSARTVILATGGAGQVFRETTNPIPASGDGLALAFRAGAQLEDMEFVQFHPTTLYIAGAARALISEVVRGAGGVLRDRHGERFMEGMHAMADLAPRDIVSRAILARMVATGDTHVYLDLSAIKGNVHTRFPTISRICRAFDIDIARDPIPVRPGAHYVVGGVRADRSGLTSLSGLRVIGEAAASRFHGANRMASNSLLEGAVMGRWAGVGAAEEGAARRGLPARVPAPTPIENAPRIHLDDMLYSLKSLMGRQVGVTRNPEGLSEALERIGLWSHYLMRANPRGRPACELVNMLTVSALIATAAATRTESRGTHYRSDHEQRDDQGWCRHIALRRGGDGGIEISTGALCEPSDGPVKP